MPWISRPGRKRSLGRGLRRWRYDHSQQLLAFWIGAVVIAVTAVAVVMMRAVMP